MAKRRWIRNNRNEKKLEQHEHTQNYYSDEPTAAVEKQCNRSKKMMRRISKRHSKP
jgi:hypothetical protein